MYRILCPIDVNTERATAQADAILEFVSVTDEVVIDILHVHERTGMPDVEWIAGGFAEESIKEMTETLEGYDTLPESVDAVVDIFEAADVEFAVHETVGNPAEAILAVATELDSDSIFLAARGRTPVGKVIFGSVAQAVMLDSDIPVTCVPVE